MFEFCVLFKPSQRLGFLVRWKIPSTAQTSAPSIAHCPCANADARQGMACAAQLGMPWAERTIFQQGEPMPVGGDWGNQGFLTVLLSGREFRIFPAPLSPAFPPKKESEGGNFARCYLRKVKHLSRFSPFRQAGQAFLTPELQKKIKNKGKISNF